MRIRGPITPNLISVLRALKEGRRPYGNQWGAFTRARRMGLAEKRYHESDLATVTRHLTLFGELVLAAYEAGLKVGHDPERRTWR